MLLINAIYLCHSLIISGTKDKVIEFWLLVAISAGWSG